MNRPTKGYYRLKLGHQVLCFRVLNCHYMDPDGKYAKIKVEWFNEKTGASWGNSFGLPRNWKITAENFDRFEKFFPAWR